ncbi:MAG: CBS domain-containing protein [Candidatus Omnitrophica bacterium]|nr:CBS domain-containing protein [Candidatus Omnitrophota bacterium]
MNARDIMSTHLRTVAPDLSIRDLANFFMEENVSGAPVTDESGAFLGIVTEEDLIFQDKKIQVPTFVNFFASLIPLGVTQMEAEIKKVAGTRVAEVMQTDPVTVTPQTLLDEIATLMTDGHAHYLPVLDQGRLVGIITKRDVIRAVARGSIW